MKLYCAISVLIALLATGVQCQFDQYQLVVPSIGQDRPLPWSTVPKQDRAFGLLYYLFISR